VNGCVKDVEKYCLPTGIGTLGAFAVHCLEPFRPSALRRLQHWDGRYITRTWHKICAVKYKWQIQMWKWVQLQTSATSAADGSGISHSNAWPGTASLYIYIYSVCMYRYVCL
jgi:hypothetical protein